MGGFVAPASRRRFEFTQHGQKTAGKMPAPQYKVIYDAGCAGRRLAGKRGLVQLASSPGWQDIGDEIHVWHASLDREAPVICKLETVLSSEEKVRADQFHFAKDRNRYVIARGLLREL